MSLEWLATASLNMWMSSRFGFRLRYLWFAVLGGTAALVGASPAVDARPTAAGDPAEVTTDRTVLQDRVARIRAALRPGEPPETGRRHFTQWYNWNNWNNGWNNWGNW